MKGLEEQIRELEIEPFEAGDEVELTAARQARRVLRGAIMSEATTGARRRARWRFRAVGVGGLALAATIAVLLTQVFVQGGTVQPQIAAAAILKRAANAALASPPERLRPGQYWYQEDTGTYRDVAGTNNGLVSAYVSQVERYWIGPRRWIRRERLVSIRPAQRITRPWQRAAMKTFSANPSISGTDGSYDLPVSYARMLAAPTTARALRNFVLRAETAPGFTPARRSVPDIMINAIHDILIEPMVPARLRAGLYRVAATIPGAKVLGTVRDGLGRPALEIGFAEYDQKTEYELLFDPLTYALLDARERGLPRATLIASGAVEGNTAFIASGVVKRIGQIPRSGARGSH